MDAWLIAKVLWKRRRLRAHEIWSRARLEAFQAGRLRELRRFAYERSVFYRRFHQGLEDAPLAMLPVLTKGELMASFSELVTAPGVRLEQIRAYLDALRSDDRFLGKFWVSRTSGSTGLPGIFLSNREEWSTVIASYSRAQEWAGIGASPFRRTRLGVVSSRVPWHQSSRVGMSVDSPFVPVRRFDATQALSDIVAGLNAWQPENLVAYASMARVLADEQLAGRLRISPRAVMCASEVLTPEAAARIERAWGIVPFNVYAATETAGAASECRHHRMHLYEDLVIIEVVDEKNRGVPVGTLGAKVLVSVLFSRTQPLIRYEMSDCVSLATGACECGMPFGLIKSIEGRTEDSLSLRSPRGAEVVVHPNVFHRLLEPLPVEEWQVVQEPGQLRILLGRPSRAIDCERLAREISDELVAAGADAPPVRIEVVQAVMRTSLGKAPLIRALSSNANAGRTG